MEIHKGIGFNSITHILMEQLPVGILFIDGVGSIRLVNSALCDWLGIQRSKVVGQGWSEVFDMDDVNHEFHQILLDVIQLELPVLKRTVPFITPDGNVLDLGVTSSFITDGEVLGGIAVMVQNVTPLAETQRHEQQRLLFEAQMNREKEESMRKLAAAMAHQIRNPISVIGGIGNLLIRKINRTTHNSSGDTIYMEEESLQAIVDEAKKLESMVNEFSVFSSIALHGMGYVNITDIAVTVLDEFSERFDRFSYCLEPSETTVWADKKLIRLNLYELIKNSIDFSSAESDVVAHVKIGLCDDGVSVIYNDTSSSIPEHLERFIFDPFFSTKAKGVGLGLSKVKRSMKMIGGDVYLDTDRPNGNNNTFVMVFPEMSHSAEKENKENYVG